MGMPGQSFQSKLEPHFAFILKSRRQRQTWGAIAQALAERGVPTTKQAVHAFIKRRLKRRYPLGMAPVEIRPASPSDTLPQAEEPTTDFPKFTPSESDRAVRVLTSSPSVKGPIWKPKK
jgi:hypothetical protein